MPLTHNELKNAEKSPRKYEQPKKIKFSSFSQNEKEYTIGTDKLAGQDLAGLKQYEFKKEFTQIAFNPNVRHRLPTIPDHLTYRYLYGHIPVEEP